MHTERALRRHLSITAADLATALNELAQIHEELAGRHPPQASEYRDSAEAARNAAAADDSGLHHQDRALPQARQSSTQQTSTANAGGRGHRYQPLRRIAALADDAVPNTGTTLPRRLG